ncbi:MAG TPA: glycosyltransferase [Chthoniobacterales bacterium]|nr:glycosyltransferase [Chthoniobacterales bacterium]
MTQPPLLIVTTRLPPRVCGIGTYSWLLHRHWPDENSHARFLVVDGATESATDLKYSSISEFNAEPSQLATILDRAGTAHLLLHYAGRAYHRYGCPLWLPRVLRDWKAKFPTSRSVIFFHELPGNNFPVSSRFFWIDKCNRRVVYQLTQLADAIATNTRKHIETIENISRRNDVHFIPVGSNIEPFENWSAERGRSEFAIFGLPFGRWQTLEMFEPEVRQWQRTGRLTKLHLIGPRDEKFDQRCDRLIEGLPTPAAIVRHGLLASNEVSQLLGRIQCGLTNVTAENWSKSTTFMAYAAHDCAVIGKVKSETVPLNLVISPEELPKISDDDLGKRGAALRRWYRDNADWSAIAKQIAGLFAGRGEKVAS